MGYNGKYKNILYKIKNYIGYIISNKIEEDNNIPITVLDSITKLYSNLRMFLEDG